MLNEITAAKVAMGRSPERAKLEKATQDFEAMLLTELLKAAPQAGSVDGAEEEGGSGEYRDLSLQGVAQAMAQNGGIGIARMLLNRLASKSGSADIKGLSSTADHVIAGD